VQYHDEPDPCEGAIAGGLRGGKDFKPRLPEEKIVKQRRHVKFVHEGRFVAEVQVDLVESEDSWALYLSLEDAYRLDDVREALRHGDIKTAAKFGRIYGPKPLAG
jgi:hypothetical protein